MAGLVSTNEVTVYEMPHGRMEKEEEREKEERERGKQTKSKEGERRRVSESGGRRAEN